MTPPWGWRQREEPRRTLFLGRDYGLAPPIAVLYVGTFLLGYPLFLAAPVLWGALTLLALAVAAARGVRLEVSPRGFRLWRTWCWVPYHRAKVPLCAGVATAGEPGGPPDHVVIRKEHHAQELTLGSRRTCEPLCAAVRAAQGRWRTRRSLDSGPASRRSG